jgi:SAM-dependent methyltransferase
MKLDKIAFYGRTLAEYRPIYDLTDADITGRTILDVAAGSASFTAEANRLGGRVTAVDPVYALPVDRVAATGAADIDRIVAAFRSSAHEFDFSFYGDLPRRVALARRALATFAADFREAADGRYVAGAAPDLPFADGAFDLALVGHFVFTYADRLGESTVEAILRETVRVADEVLVYPLLTLAGRPYEPLGAMRERLAADGVRSTVEPTRFHFQKGADKRLRLFR